MSEQLRVGVFLGGSSSEREVSLEGGRYVYQRMDRAKFVPLAIFVDSDHRCWQIGEPLLLQNTTTDVEQLLTTGAKRIYYEELPTLIDFAFVVGHGKYLEDGCFQGLLEVLGVPYNGPGVLGAALGADKWVSRRILEGAGLTTPQTKLIIEEEWLEDETGVLDALEQFPGFPLVVKPSRDGCSTAITLARTRDQARDGIAAALVWDRLVLAENALQGIEVTVSVVGNEMKEVLPVSETPRHQGKDYLTLEDKFLPGGAEMITPARLSPEVTAKVQAAAELAAQ